MEGLSAAPFAGNDDRVKEIIGICLSVQMRINIDLREAVYIIDI